MGYPSGVGSQVGWVVGNILKIDGLSSKSSKRSKTNLVSLLQVSSKSAWHTRSVSSLRSACVLVPLEVTSILV
jgi:hypothetical protein